MANKCNVCKKFISPVDGVKCTKCLALFHTNCLKLNPGHRVSAKWMCQACRDIKADSKVLPKGTSNQSLSEVHNRATDLNKSPSVETSPSGASVETSPEGASVETSPSGSASKTSPSCLAGEVRQVIREEMSGFRDELAQICATISNFNRRAEAIESRLTALEKRFTAEQGRDNGRLASLEERLSSCRMQDGSDNLNSIVNQLQNQLNNREQEFFVNDVEISGLYENNSENLVHITSLIGKKLGVEIGECDIVSAERLGPRHAMVEGEARGRPRVVTVRLARRALRDQLLRAARVRRHADTSGIIDGNPCRFYINERLTRVNKQLFYKTRNEGQRKGFRYIWTSGGRIFIRRDSNATAHRIRCDADIAKFFSIVGV